MGGAARRCVALARRYPEPMTVSTVFDRESPGQDAAEHYVIERQRFGVERAASFANRVRWQRWLTRRSDGRIHVLHAGDICVAGRVVWRTHKRLGIPYVVYVSPGSLARARETVRHGGSAGRSVRPVLGDAAGIIASTDHVASLARQLMSDVGIAQPAPVAALGLGTDPALFGPDRDSGSLRARWGIRRAPILLTVGRLVPHNGQDTGIEALSCLRDEFPDLRYVLVGEGPDEARLRNLAADLNVMDRVGFAGPMRDDELPEAYATSTIYLDASRPAAESGAEGLGLALIEAQAAGLPVIASDPGGLRSIVRDGESGIMIDPEDPGAVGEAIASLLRDADRRNEMGMLGRERVETYLNCTRLARDTARFVRECVANG